MLLPLNDNEDHVYDIEQLRIDKVSDRSCVICMIVFVWLLANLWRFDMVLLRLAAVVVWAQFSLLPF